MGRPSRRKAIVDAAVTCFSQRGSEGTSLQDIADIAGLTHTAVRYHFPSRTELNIAVLEEIDLRGLHDNSELYGSDPVTILSSIPAVTAVNLEGVTVVRLYVLMEAEGIMGDERVRQWFHERRRLQHWAFDGLLREGIRSGVFRQGFDPRLKAAEIVWQVDSAHSAAVRPIDGVDPVQVLTDYCEALLADLRTGPGEPLIR